jgi:HSP20 family protein
LGKQRTKEEQKMRSLVKVSRRRNPWSVFDELFNDSLLFPLETARPARNDAFSPRVEVSETEKEVTVSAELPGLDEKDITVDLDEDTLTIRGEKKETHEKKNRRWYRSEVTYGTFERVIPLPAHVKGDKSKARFKKGVLTVSLPKLEDENTPRRTIKVEAA